MLWVLVAALVALPWFNEIEKFFGIFAAIFIVGGLALLPGYLTAFLLFSVLLEKREGLQAPNRWPSLEVLIAAWNEEEGIARTLEALARSRYPGKMRALVVDDGSSDNTKGEVEKFAESGKVETDLILAPHAGKSAALNRGLEQMRGEWVLVLDADTEVLPGAPARLVARMLQSSKDVGAIAGSLLIGEGNFLLALQSWDYQLGIAATKRSQATLGATLVAQGAFSLYRRSFLLGVDPWIHSSGEDIILSWQILKEGEILFEPTAFAITHPPQSLRRFWRQRVRWARGMIEGLRGSGAEMLRVRAGTRHGAMVNFLFPWVDAAYTFAFLPGIILAVLGNPLIVGIWTVFLIPLQILLFLVHRFKQRAAFREAGVYIKERRLAFLGYLLFYQLILSPASLWGYVLELFKRKRKW